MVLNKEGRRWVPYAQSKVGTSDALLWVSCIWTLWGGGHKIKAVGNWSNFSSLLPAMGSVDRINARIKGRPRLDLHPSCINAVRMTHCRNTQPLGESSMRARGIMSLEGTQRCFNCKWRPAREILEEHSSNVVGRMILQCWQEREGKAGDQHF